MDSHPMGNHPTDSSEAEQVERWLGEYIDRLTTGEEVSPDEVMLDHPTCGREIVEKLEAFLAMSALPQARPGGEPLGTLGDYTLRRQVGRGGMGVVYDAWQNSLNRQVALKVLPAGMAADTKSYGRFLREAQIAAKIRHPNVVGVHGFGVEANTPYYAMEFIEGETLAQVLARLREARSGGPAALSPVVLSFTRLLSDFERAETVAPGTGGSEAKALAAGEPATLEKLLRTGEIDLIYCASLARAFAGVADGLEHAHRKGIVHRDLKPSNLIFDSGECPPPGEPRTPGSPQVLLRILDFGLARQEGQESLTASGDFVGTVLYMSPEQAMAKRIPIDKRTDIYSLGATMYEALTWRPPFQGRSAQDTLSQIIFRDPAPPRKLNPRIPRDLETIVLKCLRKDPQDRYGTAEALAQDLQRFVRGDAIEARPQGQWERWASRLWRYRKAIIAAATIALILVAGLAASSVLIWREKENTRQALVRADQNHAKARENFQKARDAVDQMLTEVGETWLSGIPGMEKVRRALLEKALKFYQGFLAEEGDDPEVRREEGMARLRMGDILERLGRHAESESAYREALAALGALAAELPGEPARQHDLARAHRALGDLLMATARPAEGKAALIRAKDILEALAARFPNEAAYREDLASAEGRLGGVLSSEGRHQEAAAAHRRAIEVRSALLEERPSDDELLMAQASGIMALSRVLSTIGAQGNTDEGLRAALKLAERVGAEGRQKPDYFGLLAELRSGLAGLIGHKDRKAAEKEYRDGIELRRKLVEDFPHVPDYRRDLASSCLELATHLQDTDQAAEAERLFTESNSILRRLVDLHPSVMSYRQELAGSLNNHGMWLHSSGKLEEAKRAFQEVLEVEEGLARDDPANPDRRNKVAMLRSNIALMDFAHGSRLEEAEKGLAQSRDELRKLREEFPMIHEYAVNLARVSVNLSGVFIEEKRFGEAEKALREGVEIQEDVASTLPESLEYRRVLGKAHLSLGEVLAKGGRLPEAEKFLDRAVEVQGGALLEDPRNVECGKEVFTFVRTALQYYGGAANFAKAEELLRGAAGLWEKLKEEYPEAKVHSRYLQFAYVNLGGILERLDRPGDAEEACLKALALAPQDPAALSLLARLLAASRDRTPERLAEADGLAAKAAELIPDKAEAWRALGVARYRLAEGRLAEGRLAEGEPAEGGPAEKVSGAWKEAIRALEKAVELGGKDGGPGGGPFEWLLLGMACWRLGETEAALKWHEKALDAIDEGGGGIPMDIFKLREEAEGVLGVRELEAQHHRQEGDQAKAEEALRDVVRFWEKFVGDPPGKSGRSRHLRFAYQNLSKVLVATGRPGDAEGALRKALALAPDDPLSVLQLVWLLAARPGQAPEKLAESVQLATRATESRPKDAGMWSTLGLARYRSAEARLAEGNAAQVSPAEGQAVPPEGLPAETASNEWTAAIEALEKSVDLGADGDPANWLLMAMARWRLGEKEEAAKCREQAIRALGESGDAPEDLQQLLKEADALLGPGGGDVEKTSI